MVLLGDGDAQPKSMEVVKKTPVTMNETKKVIDEMFTVPTVPKKRMSSCVSSIPRCISSKKFQDIMKKKEQEKKAQRGERRV